ncbi:MAG: thioredoxin family protein [Lentisphaeraceae bacterium]|nr:thioredoxin family protein [Lentisphaeraceae bacterium]
MKVSIIVALIAALFFIPGVQGESKQWETDFKKALEASKKSGKPIFMEFTGSDWCGPCMALHKRVFSTDEFKKFAAESLILLELDFPKGKQQSEELKKQNQYLQQMYQVQGYPTILFMGDDGVPFAKTGFMDVDASGYISHLKEFLVKKKSFDVLIEKANAQKGVEKAMSLVEALKTVDEEIRPFYSKMVKEIIESDPEDKTGYKREQDLNEKINKLYGIVIGLVNEKKISEAKKTISDLIATEKLTGQEKQKAMLVYVECFSVRDADQLAELDGLMDQMIKADPSSKYAGIAKNIKGQIKQFKSNL